jgi:hypothetical protein
MMRADLASNTTSGFKRTKASSCVSSKPPNLGKAFTEAGQLACLSVPTKRLQAPKTQTVSANEGNKVMMR